MRVYRSPYSAVVTGAFDLMTGGLVAGTVSTFFSDFLIAVLTATGTSTSGVGALEAVFAATLVAGFAADWTGFLDF